MVRACESMSFDLILCTQLCEFELIDYAFILIAANSCKCEDGAAKTEAECTTHQASMCASCNAGFRLNSDSTTCLGIGLVACERALHL